MRLEGEKSIYQSCKFENCKFQTTANGSWSFFFLPNNMYYICINASGFGGWGVWRSFLLSFPLWQKFLVHGYERQLQGHLPLSPFCSSSGTQSLGTTAAEPQLQGSELSLAGDTWTGALRNVSCFQITSQEGTKIHLRCKTPASS